MLECIAFLPLVRFEMRIDANRKPGKPHFCDTRDTLTPGAKAVIIGVSKILNPSTAPAMNEQHLPISDIPSHDMCITKPYQGQANRSFWPMATMVIVLSEMRLE